MSIKIKNATQIKKIIEPIPADMFIAHSFGDAIGRSCFLGYINRKLNKSSKILGLISVNDPTDYMGDDHGFGARQLTEKFLGEKHGFYGLNGAHVNNRPNINGYTEPVIKDRVMHMINDMIEAGY